MPMQLLNGINLYYEHHPSTTTEPAGTVLLLHGLGSSTEDWSDQLAAIRVAFTVLLVDLRGHGRSDKPPGPYSIKQMAEDVAHLAEHLHVGHLHVVGLSMGAQVALQLAIDHPGAVATVTAVNSPASMIPRRMVDKLAVLQRKLLVRLLGMRKIGSIIATRLLPDDSFAARRVLFADRWARNDPAAYRASFDAIIRWDITAQLPGIQQPILVVAARQDYTPLAWKEHIVDIAPDAALRIIEDSRHATPVERPCVFNTVLLEFLNENSGADIDLGNRHSRRPLATQSP